MPITNTLYQALTDTEDARVCDDISEHACDSTPQSFVLILFSYFFSKLGDALASPKTTLAWLAPAVGAPAYVLGLLVPIRESGAMLPQLFIGSVIRQLAMRKWVWVAGSVGQCLCIVGLGITAATLDGSVAGLTILALVTLFSLFRGFCSVAAKDVLGKTVSKNKRGQLSGWSASAAGLVTIVVGFVLIAAPDGGLSRESLAALLVGAGLLWLAGAAVYSFIPEAPGATDGGRSAIEALKRLRILIDDAPFRRFVITRALLMCSALSAPFFIALAQQQPDATLLSLGAFIIAGGVADLVAAPVWGRFADRSSKQVMRAAALIAASIGIATFVIARWHSDWLEQGLLLPVAYFVLSIAHSGVRVGRKTYVVNLASGNQRTDYVAISNTVIAVLLLVVGSVGALAPLIGYAGVLGLLSLMGLAGAIYGGVLKDEV